jgi:hypothetical protein
MNKRFEAYKLNRVIKRSGMELSFYRTTRNAYGEEMDVGTVVGNLKCLYHENNGRIEIDRTAQSIWRNMQTPYATALLEDIKALGLKVEDWCVIGDTRHKIGGIVDVQQWGIIGTITLEVLDNGRV